MTLASLTAPHPGTRCKPPLHKRLLARARRRPQWPGWLLDRAWRRQATPYVLDTPQDRTLLARWRARRQARAVEAARDDAYVVRIEAHAPPPLAEAQVALTALYNVLHHEHGFIVPPLTDAFGVPPAAVLPDEIRAADGHLRPGQWDDDTHAFSRFVDGGQE